MIMTDRCGTVHYPSNTMRLNNGYLGSFGGKCIFYVIAMEKK